MGATLDEISPDYLRDQRIRLSLETGANPSAGAPLRVICDFAACLPQGASVPLIFEAKGPTPESYFRRDLTTLLGSVIWIPSASGVHQITLREAAHNYWWGSLRITVA